MWSCFLTILMDGAYPRHAHSFRPTNCSPRRQGNLGEVQDSAGVGRDLCYRGVNHPWHRESFGVLRSWVSHSLPRRRWCSTPPTARRWPFARRDCTLDGVVSTCKDWVQDFSRPSRVWPKRTRRRSHLVFHVTPKSIPLLVKKVRPIASSVCYWALGFWVHRVFMPGSCSMRRKTLAIRRVHPRVLTRARAGARCWVPKGPNRSILCLLYIYPKFFSCVPEGLCR